MTELVTSGSVGGMASNGCLYPELVWVAADELLAIYATAPDRLWKRVRQLENAAALIGVICQSKG